VRVLAVGRKSVPKEGTKSADGGANTATLELTPGKRVPGPCQLAGEISLSLRSVADGDPKGKGPTEAMNDDRSGAVRVLRYGVPCVRTA
jgi:pilus assembly protein CpaB